ncbi:hypothetical protein PHYBLDRAFT_144282 [Phycomyces blakesleeanus NRRL 1555(-)]|uniref:Uncharacterized protein n=1 Tax=Phycomyces blakesleeanus (strain ATCC 8743b / DSM 1359 / FGSC 10004 / NBRC 33097 / NRRL 1555) TaxID=763407 RepID=A0A167N445_PHYB8|nr:hypothetical protein PHYBLDRAFT_144282 [Phycomyces blakesleeanus NRRL 1555(-)]OAD74929.1 hypothetical protein PHYBLDRAFT_144282 [Phycomyces blakesleeanus NRRL 1555(-)]|eukprot:XP_018292969.1 hypothetical protein PHYBLDRAFT_144282 [Phycomyces blakesleeanus NRRL 1555(-)]
MTHFPTDLDPLFLREHHLSLTRQQSNSSDSSNSSNSTMNSHYKEDDHDTMSDHPIPRMPTLRQFFKSATATDHSSRTKTENLNRLVSFYFIFLM